ncbi:MAG: hypothetical protein M1833_004579 [Piccolia ochrophora]|nr:MAG: hypothetical protein M1833_004579 [Piccolia ochrophora]
MLTSSASSTEITIRTVYNQQDIAIFNPLAENEQFYSGLNPAVRIAPRKAFSVFAVDPNRYVLTALSDRRRRAFPSIFITASKEDPAMFLGFNEYFGEANEGTEPLLQVTVFPSAENQVFEPFAEQRYLDPDHARMSIEDLETDRPNNFFFDPDTGKGALTDFFRGWLRTHQEDESDRFSFIRDFKNDRRHFTRRAPLQAKFQSIAEIVMEARDFDEEHTQESRVRGVRSLYYSKVSSTLADGWGPTDVSETVKYNLPWTDRPDVSFDRQSIRIPT